MKTGKMLRLRRLLVMAFLVEDRPLEYAHYLATQWFLEHKRDLESTRNVRKAIRMLRHAMRVRLNATKAAASARTEAINPLQGAEEQAVSEA